MNPFWRAYFQRGWFNHQLVRDPCYFTYIFTIQINPCTVGKYAVHPMDPTGTLRIRLLKYSNSFIPFVWSMFIPFILVWRWSKRLIIFTHILSKKWVTQVAVLESQACQWSNCRATGFFPVICQVVFLRQYGGEQAPSSVLAPKVGPLGMSPKKVGDAPRPWSGVTWHVLKSMHARGNIWHIWLCRLLPGVWIVKCIQGSFPRVEYKESTEMWNIICNKISLWEESFGTEREQLTVLSTQHPQKQVQKSHETDVSYMIQWSFPF